MARGASQREITPDDLKTSDLPDVDITKGLAGREPDRLVRFDDRPDNQSTTGRRGSRIPSDQELAELAFNEESVLIRLEQPMVDEKPVAAYPFSVQGRTTWVPPNQPFAVKRKYLEVILRSQPFTVETEVFKPGEKDERQVMRRFQSRRFSVSILEDKNPRGQAWAQRVMLSA